MCKFIFVKEAPLREESYPPQAIPQIQHDKSSQRNALTGICQNLYVRARFGDFKGVA